MITYTEHDTIDSLSQEQLTLMVRSKSDILIHFLEKETNFDAHQIRLMFEFGAIEAERRLKDILNQQT